MNGHACGDAGKYPERCTSDQGINTGECLFGQKQRTYLLDKYRLGPGRVRDVLAEFDAWITSMMVQTLFLQAVCILPDQNYCPSATDPIHIKNMNESRAAIQETRGILDAVNDHCFCPCKRFKSVESKDFAIKEYQGGEEKWWSPANDLIFTKADKLIVDAGFDVVCHFDLRDEQLNWYSDTCDTFLHNFHCDSKASVVASSNEFLIRGVNPSECHERRPEVRISDDKTDFTSFELLISLLLMCMVCEYFVPKFCSSSDITCPDVVTLEVDQFINLSEPVELYCNQEEYQCQLQKSEFSLCEYDHECKELLHCKSNYCRRTCESIMDCADITNVCDEDGLCSPNCNWNPCPSGFFCNYGVCISFYPN